MKGGLILGNSSESNRRFSLLSPEQCELVFESSVNVLSQVGCNIHHKGARETLMNAGCVVNGINVKIPEKLIKKSMKTVPKEITIYDRNGELAFILSADCDKPRFMAGLLNVYREDRHTQERRKTVRSDVAETALVIDRLPNIDIACGLAMISDCDPEYAEIYEVRTLLEYTSKPIQLWSHNKENFLAIANLCAEVKGGMDQLKEKPFVITGSSAFPLLGHSEHDVDRLISMFELGLPTMYVCSGILGTSAPMTIAGGLVTTLADSIVGLVLSQVINEGCPYISSAYVDFMDMSSMAFAMGVPEFSAGSMAAGDLFKYLGLPYCVHLANTDSPKFDQQAAFEIGAQIYSGMLANTCLNNFAGFIETAMSSSLESLVFADEVIGYVQKILSKIDVSPETLAVDTIKNVGPGGSFLYEEHTVEHYREMWREKNMIHKNYLTWESEGKKDYFSRANDQVNKLIELGIKDPLGKEVLDKLDAMIEMKIN